MSLPEHLSPEQVAALLRIDLEEVHRQIARGGLRTSAEGVLRADVEGALVLAAMRPLDVRYVEGVGETEQHVPEERCPSCGERGATYVGTVVLDGSLEFYHLVHTEVEHHLRCPACGARWTVLKML